MQCFVCVTYFIILFNASLTETREVTKNHEKRSLFRDVIQSLRIHSQLPEDINQNDDNNLSQSFDRYGFENELSHLPSDSEYIPRRNDRIEMPSLRYRFPRDLDRAIDKPKEQVVLFIDAHALPQTTQKPKDKTRQRPYSNKPKLPNKVKDDEATEVTEQENDVPFSNTMAGQSQIGNRESQTVVKPTVIVNIRGSVSNRDSAIRLEARNDDNTTVPLQNIFNINQEINISTDKDKNKSPSVSQEIKLFPDKKIVRAEEAVSTCETATWKPDKISEGRKLDVFQILFSI